MRKSYIILNFIFHLTHFFIITFTAFAWIWPGTRLAHLVWILLTLASWFLLGLFLGFGFCPVSSLHWKIKEKLGPGRPSVSYIHYWVAKIFPRPLSPSLVDGTVLVVTLLATGMSLYLNLK